MKQRKAFSWKSFWIVTLYCTLISLVVSYGLLICMNWVLQNTSSELSSDTILKNIALVTSYVQTVAPLFYKAVVPITIMVFLIFGWLLWLNLIYTFKKDLAKMVDHNQQEVQTGKKDFIDRKLEQDRKRRLFLHTLSIFQRDGRLLDFFQEDLSLYGDEQIGAAVRSIQEDCKKTVAKYISPKAVLDKDEGEEITIEDGFDIDSIKLTGNVAGNPPFMGIVRHSGWKAGKLDIPKLSDVKDATIIVPAEVEIQ